MLSILRPINNTIYQNTTHPQYHPSAIPPINNTTHQQYHQSTKPIINHTNHNDIYSPQNMNVTICFPHKFLYDVSIILTLQVRWSRKSEGDENLPNGWIDVQLVAASEELLPRDRGVDRRKGVDGERGQVEVPDVPEPWNGRSGRPDPRRNVSSSSVRHSLAKTLTEMVTDSENW